IEEPSGLAEHHADNKDEFVQKEKLAEQAERYDDMAQSMRKAEDSERMHRVAKKYREKVHKGLCGICQDILSLLDKFLIPKAGNPESKVFYLRTNRDHYRYLVQAAARVSTVAAVIPGSKHRQGQDAATHPIRLDVILNF
ncbi:hypothetical protein COOONC_08217, partial [Cooperia oncophora]